jgi:uncharacterized protein
MAEKRPRGFAAMNPEQQRQIASMGGRAAHQRGTAHEWDSREAAEAGRKGGKAAHHRGAEQTTASSNGAATHANGRLPAHDQEATATVPSQISATAMAMTEARREKPGQPEGIRRQEPQWSENEYENRGAPGAGAIKGAAEAAAAN